MASNPTVKFYNDLGLRYQNAFAHNPGLRSFIQRALDQLPLRSLVLDAGCGTGVPTSQMIARSGHMLHGIDFSSTMIELSRKQVPQGNFQQVDMFDYSPEQGKEFDAVFAIFSFFTLSREELGRVLVKAAAWVKPKGYLFVGTMVAEDYDTTPEMLDPDGLCAHGIRIKFMGQVASDSMILTEAGWDKLLKEAGFEIVFAEKSEFQAPAEAECDKEAHHYIAARRTSS